MENITALDLEDLNIMSAHLQDALVRYSDMRYLQKSHVFVFVANRYVWEAMEPSRCRTGFHIRNVLSVKQQGLSDPPADLVLSLLAINFEAGEDAAGVITLHFSAGFTIKLEVEYLAVHMKDLGAPWPASSQPKHEA